VEKIVVGIDGSEASKNALRWAVEDARARGAEVVALHAYEAQVQVLDATTATPVDLPGLTFEAQADAQQFVAKVVDEVIGSVMSVAFCLPMDAQAEVMLGTPTERALPARAA